MKAASLGLNHSLFGSATCQTVSPLSSAVSVGHLRMAAPHGASAVRRFARDQAASPFPWRLAFQNTPAIAVTFCMAVRVARLRAELFGIGHDPARSDSPLNRSSMP